MRKNKMFCILASMTMLASAGIFVAHNDSVSEVAAAETTDIVDAGKFNAITGKYENKDSKYAYLFTTEDGKQCSWDFSALADSKPSTTDLNDTNLYGLDLSASGSDKIKTNTNGYIKLAKSGGVNLYIPVPEDATGEVGFLFNTNYSKNKYLSLHVNGSENDEKIYTNNVGNYETLSFTNANLTTYNEGKYLHLVYNASGGEVQVKNFYVKLTTGTFINVTEFDPALGVTYNHNYVGSEDYVTETTKYGHILNTYTPTRANADFVGWYTEADCINEFDFSNTVSTATTLYAKWISQFEIEGNGNIVVDGNMADIAGLTLTLSNSSNTYTSEITDATYNFGNVKNGEYTLSINDTTGLVSITSATTITIDDDTDVIGDITIKASEKMSKTHTWDLTNGLVKGDNGNGLFASEKMKYKTDGYAQGTTNCKASNNKPTEGAYLTLYVGKAGTLRVNVHFGGNKVGFITCDGSIVAQHTGASSGEDYLFEVSLKANKVYYVYSTGSKIMLNSISYTEEIANPTATLHYQYDNDENPTAIRFISELVCDPDYIDTITYSFTKNGVAANREIKIYTVYSSIAEQDEFVQKDNTWYAVLVLNGLASKDQGSELEVTLTVSFSNGTAPITASRTLTLGQ